jgi:S1-C subfamily serine protease
MARRCMLLVFVLAFLSSSQSSVLGATFEAKPTTAPVTTMAVSEDGLLFATAHQKENQLNIWDVKTAKVIKTLECPGASALLWRGNKLFVANSGMGTISVFDQAKNWDLADQLATGLENVGYLSAPQGKNFQGLLLATGVSEKTNSPFRDTLMLIDASKDTHREIMRDGSMSVATVDYDGRYFFKQAPFGQSPSGPVQSAYDFQAVLKAPAPGTAAKPAPGRAKAPAANALQGLQSIGRGDHQDAPLLHQVAPGPHWFGNKFVYNGMPPKRQGDARGSMVIPDLLQKVFYVLDNESISCVSLDAALTAVGKQPATYPPAGEFPRMSPKRHPNAKEFGRGAAYFQNFAVTLDGSLYIYILDGEKQQVFHCKTEGFKAPTVVATTSSGAATGGTTSGPVAPADETKFPAQVAVGKAVVVKLLGENVEGAFEVVQGPKEATISAKGVLTWTPAKADLGQQDWKIKAVVNGKTSFLRHSTVVMNADEIVSASSGAPAGSISLVGDGYNLAYGDGGTSVLLLQGHLLSVLDADGMKALKQHELPLRYSQIFERKGYYIGRSANSIDLIDKKTLAVQKSIGLPGQPKFLAIHPGGNVSYACVAKPSASSVVESAPVVEIDEATGTTKELPKIFGTWVATDPSGKFLYTVYKDTYRAGATINFNIRRVLPRYESVDVLMSHELRGRAPKHLAINVEPGQNGRRLVMSPDGQHLAYVSGGGPANRMYTVPSFAVDSIKEPVAWYTTGAYPADLAYHPTAPIVAASNGKEVFIYDRTSGEKLTDRLDAGATFGNITRLMFPPSGKRLIIIHEDKKRGAVLDSIALRLTPKEQTEANKGYKPPQPIAPPKPGQELAGPALPLEKMEALRAASAAAMSYKEVARKYSDAVVVVECEGSSGTGFFIGSGGYVLTCAHVLPLFGEPTVSYRVMKGGEPTTVKAKATLIQSNDELDLAVLKIESASPLTTVQFAMKGAVETGEDVAVIGNPGVGKTILEHTLTTGVVSNPNRDLNGNPYIQMSAPINPGNSGGPMFNSQGQVIGVVVLKAKIDQAGFAVPVKSILSFLGVGKQPTSPAVSPANEYRLWTDNSGTFKIEAQFVKVEGDKVLLKKKDGSSLAVPLARLSANDREVAKQLAGP